MPLLLHTHTHSPVVLFTLTYVSPGHRVNIQHCTISGTHTGTQYQFFVSLSTDGVHGSSSPSLRHSWWIVVIAAVIGCCMT